MEFNPGKDFTRKKKWDFPTLIKFIISMESQSLKNELHKYFGYTQDCPSNPSFNQRRAQIKQEAFKYLFDKFTAQYSKTSTLLNGYRLIACDGSDINIAHNPNDEETYFPKKDAKGFNQLHLNAMYNLRDRIYTDIIIQPARRENEHAAFCEMVDRYDGPDKTIFIVDRGYESYNNMAHVIEKGCFFLFRCKDINSSGILCGSKDKLPQSDEFDTKVSLILTRKWTNEVINHPEIYRRFRNKDSFDFLDLADHAYYNMELRVLRFPISETDYECVLTNLPAEDFSLAEIKKLYAMRWGIETSFRELKYAVGLTSFHSKKKEYIIQEIWARLLLHNFCEVITANVTIKKLKIELRKFSTYLQHCLRLHLYYKEFSQLDSLIDSISSDELESYKQAFFRIDVSAAYNHKGWFCFFKSNNAAFCNHITDFNYDAEFMELLHLNESNISRYGVKTEDARIDLMDFPASLDKLVSWLRLYRKYDF